MDFPGLSLDDRAIWPAAALEYELSEALPSLVTAADRANPTGKPAQPANRADKEAIERGEGEGMSPKTEEPAQRQALSKRSNAHAVPEQ